MGETDLKHKVLAIVEEEGAARASYALKILQSEGELTIASTGKDPETGRLVTQEYRVEGPVMIFLTTTAVDIDEELLNRSIVLTVDEDRAQTQAIHRIQREAQTLEGLLARQARTEILKLHRNAQRLVRPLLVANPYARELTFLDDRDTDPARSHQVPDAHPHDRVASPAPAGGEGGGARGQADRVHRGDSGRHRGRQPPGPTRSSGSHSTSCRRRRGGSFWRSTSW